MDSFKVKYNTMDDGKSEFTTASDCQTPTSTQTECFADTKVNINVQSSVFSPLAAPFQSRLNVNPLITSPEPVMSDTASTSADLRDFLLNVSMHNSEPIFEESGEQNNSYNCFMGTRGESVGSGNIWSDNTPSRNDMYEGFDFFLKTLSSANTFVSMLTREQLVVLQSIRPSLLYELLKEVARIRHDRRMQRPLPHECAFCKNNGENEENYSSHALKDCRGRVQCPVLRAFRCPRCGATGDRAHTIKYCPANDTGLDRSSSTVFMRRRLSSSNTYIMNDGSRFVQPSTPGQSPSVSSTMNTSSFWSNFNVN